MNEKFRSYIDGLDAKLRMLLDCEPCTNGLLPKGMPNSGVYLFSEGKTYRYIGRSRNIRNRYRMHTRASSSDNQASFAFLIARQEVETIDFGHKLSYLSRASLMKNEEFAAAFVAAKSRVKQMEFRFVEETEDTIQALLEIYCSVSLATKFNKFKTH